MDTLISFGPLNNAFGRQIHWDMVHMDEWTFVFVFFVIMLTSSSVFGQITKTNNMCLIYLNTQTHFK